MDKYKCPCGYVYDPENGCVEYGIPPGTAFEDLPGDWLCPWCGYEKEYFKKLIPPGAPASDHEAAGIHDVTIFTPYPFQVGQKINIAHGPRKGDWEVVGVSKHKVKLRCPISLREFEWGRFCYQVEEKKGVAWPRKEQPE